MQGWVSKWFSTIRGNMGITTPKIKIKMLPTSPPPNLNAPFSTNTSILGAQTQLSASPPMALALYHANFEKEKQISVDPISLKNSSFSVTLPDTPNLLDLQAPPPLPPAHFNFISSSLPNSANSTPRFSAAVSTKKPNSLLGKACSSTRQQCRIAPPPQVKLRMSKSCGEGRTSAPSDDIDLWLNNPNAVEVGSRSVPKMEAKKEWRGSTKKAGPLEKQFRCGALSLCLFLPAFGKGKPVQSRNDDSDDAENVNMNVISRTVSLEKFECGSWASSAMVNESAEDGDCVSLYFDLPLELIRNSVDANAPAKSAFVFDKDRKGVLKTGPTKSVTGKSSESPRHVHFAMSSPSSSGHASPCITPRLRKARDEFNAFLEAQSGS